MKLGIREFAVFVLLLGVLAGAYVLGFSRLQQQQVALRADIQTKRATLEDLRTTAAAAKEIGQQLDRLSTSLDYFEQRLPRQKEVDQILQEIWKLAEANSLSTKSVRPMKIERGPRCSEQPIELMFEGYYPGFNKFMKNLEALNRITRVTQMSLIRVDRSDAPMKIKMTLIIFYEPDAPAMASGK